jgi:hypothetical protein
MVFHKVRVAICNDGFLRQCKLHGKCSRSIARRLPTLKKPTDDMTNQGLAVNMHAVRPSVAPCPAATTQCLSSSIG